jgi:DNA-binding response OmpR family regulator
MALKNILLVEDSETSTMILREASLQWKGSQGAIEIVSTSSLAGLRTRIADTKQIDLILLDLVLLDSSEDETIKFVEEQHGNLPPIVIVTANDVLETRQRCLSVGACGFALKRHIFISPNFFFSELYNVCYFRYLKRLL